LLQDRSPKAKHVTRVSAHDLETVVVAELRSLLEDPAALLDLLTSEVLDLAEQQALLHAAARLAERWPVLPPTQLCALVQAVVARVVLREQQIDIELMPSWLRDFLQPVATDALSSARGERGRKVTLSLEVRLKRCRGAMTLIVPARVAQACPSRPNPALIKGLVRAHQWFDQLRAGHASSIRQIALTERLTERYVARILQLAFLAPDIQEAILHGRQPPDLTIEHLRPPLPLTWSAQRQRLGFRQVCEQRPSDRLAVACNDPPMLRASHQQLPPL
jgi:hypothetical protein